MKYHENNIESEKVIRGAITIVYKNVDGKHLFLVVENTKTGNISFVSGAEEETDNSLLVQTAQREIEEELGLKSDQYKLVPTEVRHEFVFDSKKVERAGKKASYQVYLADATNVGSIEHTSELKSAKWMTKNEVLDSLTFPELKVLFKEATKAITNLPPR